MTDQIGGYNANNIILLKNVVSLKEEECQDEDFVDDKISISETTIITDHADLRGHLICDKIEHHDVSTTLGNIKKELSLANAEYDMIQDNLKIEEGISADEIKIEINNKFLYCEDCQAYREDYCVKCEMLVHILNKAVPSNIDMRLVDRLSSDNILEVRDYFGQYHLFALKVIPVGVRFGPVTGLNQTDQSWKIKGGKFVVNNDTSKYLNWMQYVNPARNIFEQNLRVFQYEHYLYYESTRQIEKDVELLVYFGEEYQDSLNRNIEMDFIPTAKHIFKDAFACTFCCLGFSSKLYLAKHKTICPRNSEGAFSIEELMRCPTCKIHMGQQEYIIDHMAYCCEKNDRKCILPTLDNRTAQVHGRKTRSLRMYNCQQCKYRTKYKGDLKNHVNMHYEVKMYKCRVCCTRFKTKEVLSLHIKNEDICAGRKEDSEDSTGVYMKAQHLKAEHLRSEAEMKQFKYSSREFRTKHKTSLRRHLKQFKYKCDTCEYKARQKSHLKAHTETKHLKEFKYKCGTCDYTTNWKANLRQHMEAKHLKEFKYRCGTCDYTTNWKANLKQHIEAKHMKEFKYKCDTCEYKTNRKNNLQQHVEAKHLKEFKHKCDKCDYKANLKSNLKRHIETSHFKEFKYKCDKCDYKTNQISQLKTHIKTRHLKEFKYKCDICEYKANLKCNLKRHLETKHLKEFKYRCDACDYKANLKSQLKTHIEAKHLNELKYQCDICDYRANRKSNLKVHIDAKHLNEFKYKCGTCKYTTNWKTNLKKHTEGNH